MAPKAKQQTKQSDRQWARDSLRLYSLVELTRGEVDLLCSTHGLDSNMSKRDKLEAIEQAILPGKSKFTRNRSGEKKDRAIIG